MKKVIIMTLIAIITSSCSLLSEYLSNKNIIKIDYKRDIVEINNVTGQEFKLKIISSDIDNPSSIREANYFVVATGSHSYSLIFMPRKDFQLSKLESKKMPKNSVIIYTKIEKYKNDDSFKQRLVHFSECSNLDFNDHNALILFNTVYNPNLYFKYIGLEGAGIISCDGGVGSLQDVDKRIKGQTYIGGLNRGATSGAPIESL